MPTPIVLDCDPGHDDAIALLLALASPELEVRAVTTSHGNQILVKTTSNALRVLELVDRGAVPVGKGFERPLVRPLTVVADVHGASGLDGPVLPPASASIHDEVAVAYVVDGSLVATPRRNVEIELDAERFLALLLDRIGSLDRREVR